LKVFPGATVCYRALQKVEDERTEQAKVQLTIDAPETTQAGGELVYKIKILNQDSSKLVDMNLELVYDEGITYSASTLKNVSASITSSINATSSIVTSSKPTTTSKLKK
jgi:hypothetical protein